MCCIFKIQNLYFSCNDFIIFVSKIVSFFHSLTLCDTLVERNEKEMKIRKILFCLFTISMFYSCSTSKISESEISKINGTFEANSSNSNIHYNLVSLLNRKLLKDTLYDKPINMYKLKLKIIDKNILKYRQ